MKILTKENNVIVYIVDNDTIITQNDRETYIGQPVDCYFPEVTTSNSFIHEGVDGIPSNVTPNLYCYDGTSFSLNNEDPRVKSARHKRNELLAETDWTQLLDITVETRNLWEPYRQALRDLTAQDEFPQKINWPTKPE